MRNINSSILKDKLIFKDKHRKALLKLNHLCIDNKMTMYGKAKQEIHNKDMISKEVQANNIGKV